MKTSLILLATTLLFILQGCTVTGEYFSGDGFNNKHLTLSKDSTFIYETFHDVGGTVKIEGKWSQKKNMITLNSYAQPDFISNSVVEKFNPQQENKLIIVQNLDVPAYKSVISLNNGQQTDTLMLIHDTTYLNKHFPFIVTGIYTSIDTIKSIQILESEGWTDCVLKESKFHISNPKANVIIIYALPYNLYYGMKYIVDAEWKYKRNRIYNWRVGESKFSKKIFLRKK